MNIKFLSVIVLVTLILTPLTAIKTSGESFYDQTMGNNSSNTEKIIEEIEQIQDKSLIVDKIIGEKQVLYYEHFINDVQIKNDSILVHKDKNNGEIIRYEKSWVDSSDIQIKSLNTNFSLVNIENYYWEQKVFFIEEKDCMDFYKFNKPVVFPVLCLEVRFKDGRTVLYDKEGKEIGVGIQAPSEAFLMTGPHEGNDVWKYLRSNAESYYSKWYYPITSVFNPYPSTEITPRVSDPNVELFYEVAHGGSTSFKAHTNAYYYSSMSSKDNVKADMSSRQPMRFAFIGSCNGMSSTGEGKFSYEFRKGQMVNTVTVGYTGMGDDDGWPKAKPWQDAMFTKMDLGYTIKYSFDYACGEYPTIADAVKFVGDETLKIMQTGNQPPYAPYNPSPEDETYNLPINTLLSWLGGDPNDGDIVYYDVYLEVDDPTPDDVVSSDQTSLTFQTTSLMYNTNYYWKIVARDNHNEVTEGPVWHFKTSDYSGDNIDQQQDQSDTIFSMYESSSSISAPSYAQSFKPDETILSSVKLFIKKAGNPSDISIDIRNSLEGSNLISASKPGNNIPLDLEWVEFDFPDININIGGTYYIVVSAEGTDNNNRYMLSVGIDTDYDDGMLFIAKTKDGPWGDGLERDDLTFRTYTQGDSNNDPPFAPVDPSPDDNEILNKPSVEDADVNNDGVVNVLDAALVAQHYGETGDPGWIDEDVDNDGEVDRIDADLVVWHVLESLGPSVHTEIFVFDPDGDSLNVKFYWSDGTLIDEVDDVPSGTVAGVGSSSTLDPGSYSWYVVVDDGINTAVQSSTYSFTIQTPGDNNPPYTPSNSSPEHEAIGVNKDTILSWTGGDPDGDSVTYTVYFGTDDTPDSGEPVSEDQSSTIYDPGTLEDNTKYYWQVIATDSHGETSESSIFEFTTFAVVGKDFSVNIEPMNNKKIEVEIVNDGGEELTNIEYNISVEGIIFHKIDCSSEGIISVLEIDNSTVVKSPEMSGFDIVKVSIEVTVDDTKKVDKFGIILLGFIFLFA